jgi:hypothetical protein
MPVEVEQPGTARKVRFSAIASLVLLALHLAGGAYAIVTLMHAQQLRMLLGILYGSFSWLIFAAIAVVPLLAAWEIKKSVTRLLRKQSEEDLALRVRAALYLAAGCLFADVFLLTIRFDLIAELSLTFAYGTYALWSMLLPRLRNVVPNRLRRVVDVVCMNALLILVLAEIGLRIAAVVWPIPLLVTQSSSQQVRLSADRSEPGTFRFDIPVNAGGHYDTEFVGRSALPGPLVVSIGDSFSYGMVPHAFHFTTMAEQQLPGVEFYNMGFPAIGPSEYRYLLEKEALPLEPDVVVVQLFLGNDLTDAPDPGTSSAWYRSDRYMVSVVWQRLQILRRARPSEIDAAGVAGKPVGRDELMARHAWLADPLVETPTFTRELFLDVETEHAKAITGPDDEVYSRFFREIEDLERTAGKVPLVFVLIPDEFQVEDSLWEEVTRKAGQPLDRDRPQRKVVEWLQARGRPVLDLLPILRSVEPLKDGRKHLYHLQDTHFNARGNNVAGHALASFVKPLLPKPEIVRTDSVVTLRYKRTAQPAPLSGGFTLNLDVQGPAALVSQVRASAPILSIERMQVSGNGGQVISANSQGSDVQVAFEKARVEGIYKSKPFQFDFEQSNRPKNLEQDPLQLISWVYSLGGRRFSRGVLGEYTIGDEKTDAQTEAMGVIIDAPVRLPEGPAKVGDEWTSEWKGARAESETQGVFRYRQTAQLRKIEEGESPRAHIGFSTSGQLEIPAGRNESRGEATVMNAEGTILLDLLTGRVVSSETSGTITSDFRVGFKIIRGIKTKYEER